MKLKRLLIFCVIAGLPISFPAYRATAGPVVSPTAPSKIITATKVDITTVTDGNLPYMQAAGAGFGDSPLSRTDADTITLQATTGKAATLVLSADAGEDNADDYRIQVADNGDVTLQTYTSGSWVTISTWTSAGNYTVTGALAGTTLNTGQGDNELYAMNQDVETTDSPTFVTAKLSGLTDNYLPKHTNDSTGLENSAVSDSGTAVEINQNSVQPFTSVASGAVDNTLYLKEGKVGIGMNAPVTSLHVIGNITASYAGTGTDAAANVYITGNEGRPAAFYLYADEGDDPQDKWRFQSGTTNDFTISNFYGSAWTDLFTLTYTGNVGIATTAPDNLLDLNLGTTGKMQLTYNDANGSAANYATFGLDSNGGLTITTVDDGAGTDGDITLDPDGVVVTTEDIDMSGKYLLQSQSIADLHAQGPGYWFDGSDDDVVKTDDDDLDFGTDGDFSIVTMIKPLDVTRTTDYIVNKEDGGIGWGMYLNQDDFYIRLDDNATDPSAIIGTAQLENNTWGVLACLFDRSGNATGYMNGELTGTVDISGVTSTISNAGALHIANDSADGNEFNGEIAMLRVFNLALDNTDATDKAIINGGPVPYKYQGASQTELITNGNMELDANWGTYNGAPTNERSSEQAHGGTYSRKVITDGNNQGINQTITVIKGKNYRYSLWIYPVGLTQARLTFGNIADLNGTPTLTANAWNHVTGVATSTGTGGVLVFTLGTYGTGTFYVDDVSVTQIGCVLDLNPSGVTSSTWVDASGNGLDGTVSGAIANNYPSAIYIAEEGATSPKFEVNETGAAVFQNTTDSTTGFQVMDADGGTPVLNVDTTNERVGIGTASPAKAFHVSASNSALRFQNTVVSGKTWDIANYIDGVSNHGFAIQNITDGVKPLIILPGGNVGIATTAPDKALEVNSATGANLRLTFNDGDGSATNYTDFSTDASGDITVAPSGSDFKVTGDIGISTANVTVGSGTGITVNHTGRANQQVYKVTTTYAAYADTDTTKGIVIATLPAKTKLIAAYADTTAAYTGGTVSATTLEVGVTAEGAAEILAVHDVLSGVTTKGLADADMGTSMTRAAAIQGGYLPSWSGTTAVYATIDTTNGNTNALTAGSTTFYLVTERY